MEYAVIGLLNHMTNGICRDWLIYSLHLNNIKRTLKSYLPTHISQKTQWETRDLFYDALCLSHCLDKILTHLWSEIK